MSGKKLEKGYASHERKLPGRGPITRTARPGQIRAKVRAAAARELGVWGGEMGSGMDGAMGSENQFGGVQA